MTPDTGTLASASTGQFDIDLVSGSFVRLRPEPGGHRHYLADRRLEDGEPIEIRLKSGVWLRGFYARTHPRHRPRALLQLLLERGVGRMEIPHVAIVRRPDDDDAESPGVVFDAKTGKLESGTLRLSYLRVPLDQGVAHELAGAVDGEGSLVGDDVDEDQVAELGEAALERRRIRESEERAAKQELKEGR